MAKPNTLLLSGNTESTCFNVSAWCLSNSLDSNFCVDVVGAIANFGTPAIFNTGQVWQFTSAAFINVLKPYGIAIRLTTALMGRSDLQ